MINTVVLIVQLFFECVLVEERTREQRKSRVWFDQRAGRVTASMFHKAARTEKSPSLIKRVCYPRSSQFSTEATRYTVYKFRKQDNIMPFFHFFITNK